MLRLATAHPGRGQIQGCHGSGWPRPRCSWPRRRWLWPVGHGQAQSGHGSTKLRLVSAHVGHGPGPPKPYQCPSLRARPFLHSDILAAHKSCFKDDKLPLFLEREQTPRFYSWKKTQLPVSIRVGHSWLPCAHIVGDMQNWDIPALPHPCQPWECQATQAEDEIPVIQSHQALLTQRNEYIYFFSNDSPLTFQTPVQPKPAKNTPQALHLIFILQQSSLFPAAFLPVWQLLGSLTSLGVTPSTDGDGKCWIPGRSQKQLRGIKGVLAGLL